MKHPSSVLIVGGSLAGCSFAERLRQNGFEGSISIVDQDHLAPYDRPPLSKRFLDDVDLAETPAWKPNNCEWICATAVGFDLHEHSVTVTDDTGHESKLSADTIVFATGASARGLPFGDAVLTVRTVEDAIRLRQMAQTSHTALIIGAGAIGAEVASVLAEKLDSVTLVDSAPLPLIRMFGEIFAPEAAKWMRDAGLTLRLNSGVANVEKTAEATRVTLTSGEVIDVDFVVASVGSVPNIQWLENSGVLLDNGIACDASGRVLNAQGSPLSGVYAIGDVSAWTAVDGTRMRSEAWSNAQLQAQDLAQIVMGSEIDERPIFPYFWTDILGRKVKILGFPAQADAMEIISANPEKKAGVYRFTKAETVMGWITVNSPRDFAQLSATGTLE